MTLSGPNHDLKVKTFFSVKKLENSKKKTTLRLTVARC